MSMPFGAKPKRFERAPAHRQPPPDLTSLARVILLAVLVAIAAGWAAVRHYAKPAPMLNPAAPKTAPTYDADAGEVPVPDWSELDAS
jgi:hypothetical protein